MDAKAVLPADAAHAALAIKNYGRAITYSAATAAAGLDTQPDDIVSTLIGCARVHPSSGATAVPLLSSMTKLCSGQVTRLLWTMPCDSGPPLCGQRRRARTPRHRRSGTPQCLRTPFARRASRARGIIQRSDFNPLGHASSSSASGLNSLCRRRAGRALPRDRFARIAASRRSGRTAPCDWRDHRPPACGSHRDRPGRTICTCVQIPALLAIELGQRGDDFERLLLGRDLGEEFGALDVKTGGAGEMDLIPGIDADDADVLAGRFRAIARAPDTPSSPWPRPRAPHELLDLDAEAGQILCTEAAPFRTDAGLHRPQPFA